LRTRSRSAASATRLSAATRARSSFWLERRALDRLEAERRRGEDLSDTIVRISKGGCVRENEDDCC
jgi:hypothetical protein